VPALKTATNNATKAALRVIAVGRGMPSWVDDCVADYSKRMPTGWQVEWVEVKAAPRERSASPAQWMQRECQAIEAALPPNALRIVLDERGKDLSSEALAQRWKAWQADTRMPCLIIGGPDGLDAALKASAHESLRLSSLTLPHPMVRVLLAEQLYRAWSIIAGHPYHRE
jgi:23S rRNA (pseudouridine1915-N3)-methyltransferase